MSAGAKQYAAQVKHIKGGCLELQKWSEGGGGGNIVPPPKNIPLQTVFVNTICNINALLLYLKNKILQCKFLII